MKIANIIELLDNMPNHDDKYYIEIVDNKTEETLLFERASKVYYLYDEWIELKNGLLDLEVTALSPNVITTEGIALDGITFYV
ncbi:hypothetical protein EF36P1_00022 [Enterococcus phage EF36P1]|nr:hypothetical protein EF36P1_00022 [Enterococcus phage EF36P1]WAX14917.1 hypothetical protein EF36P2_00040 [Enterococcus phage EF36P2]WAX14989.1 hypothetical protein EF36P3_00050 [Enterococcus phage EF36P3]